MLSRNSWWQQGFTSSVLYTDTCVYVAFSQSGHQIIHVIYSHEPDFLFFLLKFGKNPIF